MIVRDEPLETAAGPVETLVAVPDDRRPAFAVVYVHGYGFDAVSSLPAAWYLAQGSALCLLVSQPGFGRSVGPPDYCGPKTVSAVIAASERLLDRADVPRPLGIWGFSRGAIVSGQVITKRPDLFGAAVLQAGGYDLERAVTETLDEGLRTNLLRETGGVPAVLRERSLIHHVEEVRCPVLVLQGNADYSYMPHNARRLVDEFKRVGVEHEYKELEGEHELPWSLVAAEAVPFLAKHLSRD